MIKKLLERLFVKKEYVISNVCPLCDGTEWGKWSSWEQVVLFGPRYIMHRHCENCGYDQEESCEDVKALLKSEGK